MRLPLIAALALCLSALLPSACTDCVRERCAYPALFLTVHAAFGGDYLSDATLTQAGTPLSNELSAAACSDGSCTHAVTPPASGPVTVSFAGYYKDASVPYVSRADACGNVIRQAVTVAMVPVNQSASPTVSPPTDRGAGCNR